MKVSEMSEVAKALNCVLERNAIETASECSDIQPLWTIKHKFDRNFSKRPLRFPKSCAAKLLQQINEKEIIKPFKDKAFVNDTFEKLILSQHCPNTLLEKHTPNSWQERESESIVSNDSSRSEKMWQNVATQVENSCKISESSQTEFSLLEVVLDILDDNKQSLNLMDSNCFKELENFLDKKHLIEETNCKDDNDDSLKNCTSLVSMSQRKLEPEAKASDIQKTEKDASAEDIFTKLTEIEDMSLVIEALDENTPKYKRSKDGHFKRNFNDGSSFDKFKMNLGSLNQISDKDEAAVSVDLTLQTENNLPDNIQNPVRLTETPQKIYGLEDNESSVETTVFNFSHEREQKRIGTALSNDTKSSRSGGRRFYSITTPLNHYTNKSLIDESHYEYQRQNNSSAPPKTLSRNPTFYSRPRSKERRDFSEPRIIDIKRQQPVKHILRHKSQSGGDTVKQKFYISDTESVKENLVEPIRDRRAISIINRYECRVCVVSKQTKIKGTFHSIIEIIAPSKKQLAWLARDFNRIFPKWNMQSQLVR